VLRWRITGNESLAKSLGECFLEFKEDFFQEKPYNPYCIWLPIVDDLRTFFIAPSREIINYFGWGNKTQNMAFY
jgi:hypothetical protein